MWIKTEEKNENHISLNFDKMKELILWNIFSEYSNVPYTGLVFYMNTFILYKFYLQFIKRSSNPQESYIKQKAHYCMLELDI